MTTMNIGIKLRLLRGNITQGELARRSGVDKAIISKIEAGKMAGSVSCHQNLAQAFGLKLSEFYSYMEKHESVPVELHQGDKKDTTYGNFLEIITSIPLSKRMLPVLMTLKKNEVRFLEETMKKVEWFIMLLEGEVQVDIEGKVYKLARREGANKGDSIYSMSSKKHVLRNIGAGAAKLLCVSSPPVL